MLGSATELGYALRANRNLLEVNCEVLLNADPIANIHCCHRLYG
jgi:hypothetical protein